MQLTLRTNKQLLIKLLAFFDFGIFYFLRKILYGALLKVNVIHGYSFSVVLNRLYIYPSLYFFRYHSLCLFRILVDIIGIDNIGGKQRFTVGYSLLSVKYNIRCIVKVNMKTYEDIITCTSLFFSGNWLEREIHEFYGIFFLLNKDLRHLLLDYGFSGHPLRKDFPISGFLEVVYNDTNKKLSYHKLELVQTYRQSYLRRSLI